MERNPHARRLRVPVPPRLVSWLWLGGGLMPSAEPSRGLLVGCSQCQTPTAANPPATLPKRHLSTPP